MKNYVSNRFRFQPGGLNENSSGGGTTTSSNSFSPAKQTYSGTGITDTFQIGSNKTKNITSGDPDRDKAFAEARKAGKKTFMYKGQSFTTDMASDKSKELSVKRDFTLPGFELPKPNMTPIPPVTPNPDMEELNRGFLFSLGTKEGEQIPLKGEMFFSALHMARQGASPEEVYQEVDRIMREVGGAEFDEDTNTWSKGEYDILGQYSQQGRGMRGNTHSLNEVMKYGDMGKSGTSIAATNIGKMIMQLAKKNKDTQTMALSTTADNKSYQRSEVVDPRTNQVVQQKQGGRLSYSKGGKILSNLVKNYAKKLK